ncbi:hypothetical protein GN958_ATG12182, partial [Phytophthora infestans]
LGIRDTLYYPVLDSSLLKVKQPYNRYESLFSMGYTGVCIDNPGRLTIDVCGAKHVDVVQETGENEARCSALLCASARWKALPAFVGFSGVPGADVYTEVSDPKGGHPN